MKRPEGFDPHTPVTPPSTPRKAESGKRVSRGKPHQPDTGRFGSSAAAQSKRAGKKGAPARAPRPSSGALSESGAATESKRSLRRTPPSKVRGKTERGTDSSRRANAEAHQAARLRRKYERNEVRRFTKRSRHRRLAWLTVAASFVVLCVLVIVAVYSPLLALKTIKIEGASSVSATDLRTALGHQLGTPLALVDFGSIKTELGKFPLIRSYVTETVPPNTLVIHIVERAPLGVVETASGFTVVDAAGVTLSRETERPAKLPLIDSGSTVTTSAAFKAAVSVLLALPASVSTRVDTVSARTNDDVTLVLDGAGQKVVWGSAERSAEKARVLADLIAHQDPKAVVEYDVSAPNSAVVRPAS